MPRKPSDKDKLRPDVAETAYRTMLEATGHVSLTKPTSGELDNQCKAKEAANNCLK